MTDSRHLPKRDSIPVRPTRSVLFLDSNSANLDPAPELLTLLEVAELLKTSIPTVRRLQQKRLLPFFKIGGAIRFSRDDLAAYIEECRVEAVDQ